jgi:hypothetical protein
MEKNILYLGYKIALLLKFSSGVIKQKIREDKNRGGKICPFNLQTHCLFIHVWVLAG